MKNSVSKFVLKIGLALLIFFFASLVPTSVVHQLHAQTGGGGMGGGGGAGGAGGGQETSFGGANEVQIDCTCSDDGSWILYVQDYKTNNLLYLICKPGESVLFDYKDILGRYLLGTYSQSSDQCKVGEDPYCATLTANGKLGKAPGTGTSKLIGVPLCGGQGGGSAGGGAGGGGGAGSPQAP